MEAQLKQFQEKVKILERRIERIKKWIWLKYEDEIPDELLKDVDVDVHLQPIPQPEMAMSPSLIAPQKLVEPTPKINHISEPSKTNKTKRNKNKRGGTSKSSRPKPDKIPRLDPPQPKEREVEVVDLEPDSPEVIQIDVPSPPPPPPSPPPSTNHISSMNDHVHEELEETDPLAINSDPIPFNPQEIEADFDKIVPLQDLPPVHPLIEIQQPSIHLSQLQIIGVSSQSEIPTPIPQDPLLNFETVPHVKVETDERLGEQPWVQFDYGNPEDHEDLMASYTDDEEAEEYHLHIPETILEEGLGSPNIPPKRHIFTPEQKKVLEEHFKSEQYPSPEVAEGIGQQIGLNRARILKWFNRARASARSRLKETPEMSIQQVVVSKDTEASKMKSKFLPEQLEVLLDQFGVDPWPVWERVQELGVQTGLSHSQIKNWFNQKRKRARQNGMELIRRDIPPAINGYYN